MNTLAELYLQFDIEILNNGAEYLISDLVL